LNTHPSHTPQPPYYEEDELTLKDIILVVKDYSAEIVKNLKWIILATLLAAGGAFYLIKPEPTTYTSDISFLIQEEKGEMTIPTNPITGNKTGKRTSNKIVQLAFSSSVINRILLEPVSIHNKKDFFANYLIDVYGFHNKWNNEKLEEGYKQLRLQDFYFISDNLNNFTTKEHRALQTLRDFVKKMFSVDAADSNLTKITVTAKEDKISFQLRDLLFNSLKELYIENTIGRTQRHYNSLTLKVDSLENKFRLAQRQLAAATDQSYGLVSKSSYLRKGQIQEEAAAANKIYQTFLSQQQEVELKLNSNTPDFLVIDQTFLPRKKANSSFNKILISALLGGFLSLGFVIVRKMILDALKG